MINNVEKPNIVLITADQWRGDCLGFLQNRHPVMTPHINQLAAEGVAFTRAYADCPVCMPQRVTTLTGMAASRFGFTENFSERSPVNINTSLPGLLARNGGYQTKAVGKMHFSPDRARLGFEHITLHPNDYVNWLEDSGYGGMYRGHGLGGNEVYPAVSAVPERFTHSHWIVDQGINFIGQRDPEAPFFLWMVFEAPHSPFDPPAPYDRMYDNFTIQDPVYGDWANDEDFPPSLVDKSLSHKYGQLNDEMIREAKRRYYGQISHIDYQLGRFLGELKSKGLYDNTVIVFTSDHGEHLGDHGMFAKCTFLRGSADVPLIMRFPASVSIKERGLVIDEPVLTADICPTLLDIADVVKQTQMDGISLLPYIEKGYSKENRIICGECGNGTDKNSTAFATDGKYKYIYYSVGGKEQLFDIENDEDDLKNLIGNSEYEQFKQPLKNELKNYLGSFCSEMVKNREFVVGTQSTDKSSVTSNNPFAWRGPLRYGQGY